jgi:hypothetical protein
MLLGLAYRPALDRLRARLIGNPDKLAGVRG